VVLYAPFEEQQLRRICATELKKNTPRPISWQPKRGGVVTVLFQVQISTIVTGFFSGLTLVPGKCWDNTSN
jgi:hypothetical protein